MGSYRLEAAVLTKLWSVVVKKTFEVWKGIFMYKRNNLVNFPPTLPHSESYVPA